MFSVFDLEKLHELLRDYYEITHIRITVFDESYCELTSYPEQLMPFCQEIRRSEAGMTRCYDCDRLACIKAANNRDVTIYECHAGLTEAIIPLYVGDVLVGYLLFGQLFPYTDSENGLQRILERCEGLPLNLDRVKKIYRKSQTFPSDYIRSAAKILHAVASFVILERMAALQEDRITTQIDTYLRENFTKKMTVEEICRQFKIGKTQLYQLSSQLYGCGIMQQVRKLRMEYAKQLLLRRRSLTIGEIAAACGYDDYNYFICSFSKTYHISPNEYRKAEK